LGRQTPKPKIGGKNVEPYNYSNFWSTKISGSTIYPAFQHIPTFHGLGPHVSSSFRASAALARATATAKQAMPWEFWMVGLGEL
jgi:hypothetical protein